MSPASQGVLEVERYIGSCLISSNVRGGLHGKFVVSRKQEPATTTTTTTVVRGGKTSRGCYNNGGGQSYPGLAEHQQYGGPGGWTGAPLISMMSSPRRCNQRSSPSLNQQQQQTCDQQQVVPGGPHKNPLSRLAIHTQGAPLILAGRFYNRGKVHGGNPPSNYIHSNGNGPTRFATSRIASQRPADAKKPPPTMVSANSKTTDCSPATTKENVGSSNIANIDSLSIASDESSGSNNSENSLPRIIKPRKRRKKDRKPPNNVVAGSVEVKSEESQRQQQQQQQQPAGCGATIGEQSNVAGARSYAPSCYEARIYEAAVPHLRNYRRPPVGHRDNNYGACRTPSMQAEMADVRQQRYVHHRHHVQVKVLDDNRNVIAAPMRVATPLKSYRHHHDNADCNLPRRFVHEYPGESCEEAARRDGPGPCQCRYCDPAGLIWEVDRNGCYSSFLTTATTTTTTTTTTLPPPPPPVSSSEYRRNHFGQMPLFLTSPTLDERAFDDDAGSAEPGGVALRRSWSDPTSYFSYGEEIVAPTRDVGVIGDRGGQFESGNHKRTLWRGDSIGGASTSSPANANGGSAAGGSAGSPKGLEVSTEIVTSPNGHRDLEIKFYSSSSSSPAEHLAEEDKSSSLTGEPDDDDNGDDDLSDIWSYHELKLQQDFRTLLQAEE